MEKGAEQPGLPVEQVEVSEQVQVSEQVEVSEELGGSQGEECSPVFLAHVKDKVEQT